MALCIFTNEFSCGIVIPKIGIAKLKYCGTIKSTSGLLKEPNKKRREE
jgi:hypothetical protein